MATASCINSGKFWQREKYIYTPRRDNAVSYYPQQLMVSKTKVDKVYSLQTSHSPFFSQSAALADLIVND